MTASWRDWQQALDVLLRHVDWPALGAVYFHRDGERLLAGRKGELRQQGEAWARAAARRLPRGGRSLWVGAGLNELPAMLAEVLVEGRTVVAANLRQRECKSLNATLRQVNLHEKLAIDCRDAAELAAERPGYDHLAAVAVFTDPETFPLLSAVGYGRLSPVQLDVDAFVAERQRARALAAALWQGLSRPGLITTTADEVAWFADAAGEVELAADDDLIPTAIVGDPIGFLRAPATAG